MLCQNLPMQKLLYSIVFFFASQYVFSNTYDSIKGYWHGFGLILEIRECEDKFCAEIDYIFVSEDKNPLDVLDKNNQDKKLRSRPLIGSNMLFDFDKKPDAQGSFIGKIYNPENGKSYKSKIQLLDSDVLEIKGCVTVICQKAGEWLRVDITYNESGQKVANLTNPLAIY